MQKDDFPSFQPLNGSVPYRVLAVHPTEPFVALQVFVDWRNQKKPIDTQSHLRCAIWHRETGEIVCEPEDAVALAWNAEGNEIGLVREWYDGPGDDPTTPLFHYTWERYSWPEQAFAQSCDLSYDTNWPESVVFSPLDDLVVIQWFDVDRSGFDFVGLTKYGDHLLEENGLPPIEDENDFKREDGRFSVNTTLTTLPVFSADGRSIVFCWQPHQHWWTDVPDDVYVEGELAARVGECLVGYVQIIDWENRSTYSKALFATVPPGWQPSYEGDRSNELLREPVYLDNGHVQVSLPTGEVCVLNIFI